MLVVYGTSEGALIKSVYLNGMEAKEVLAFDDVEGWIEQHDELVQGHWTTARSFGVVTFTLAPDGAGAVYNSLTKSKGYKQSL
jgi:predicted acylesterase/phospholipase RssA